MNETWRRTYGVLVALILAMAGVFFMITGARNLTPAVKGSIVWGALTLLLSLVFMLGAADTPRRFLLFFSSGAFGAGLGYLVGAWLTPNGENNPLDQARNVIASALAGVVGTKLLSLWDDLVDKPAGGGPPPILTANVFILILLWFVGFTVSLAAFYTVRSSELGEVRITFDPAGKARVLESRKIGVLPGDMITFNGAANSSVDVALDWVLRPAKACSDYTSRETDTASHTTTFLVIPPTTEQFESLSKDCSEIRNFVLVATSVRDRSKTSKFDVKFCSSDKDCVAGSAAELTKPKPAK